MSNVVSHLFIKAARNVIYCTLEVDQSMSSRLHFSIFTYRDGEVAFDVNERTADKIVEFMKE